MVEEALLENSNSTSISSLNTLYSDESGNILWGKKRVSVIMTSELLSLFSFSSKRLLKSFDMSSIVGSKVASEKKKFRVLEIYSYPKSSGGIFSTKGLRSREVLELEFDMSNAEVTNFSNAIDCVAMSKQISRSKDGAVLPATKRKFIAFINPVSGTGSSPKIWKSVVKPMFLESNIDCDVVFTEYANHAFEISQSLDPSLYDALVIIGGDGLLSEIVNGINSRSDSVQVFSSLPLVPIPGGSGNGLAKSILHEIGEPFSITNSVFAAIKGVSYPLDLSYVSTPSKSFVSFLMFGWGLISDIDLKSDPLRFLGELRFYLAAIYFILIRRTYPGRLSMYVGANGSIESSYNNRRDNDKRQRDHKEDILQGRNYTHHDFPEFSDLSLPNISEPLPEDGWITIEGEFSLVWVVQTSHASVSTHSGPSSYMDDGIYTIFVARNMSRCELLSLMLVVDDGKHLDHPGIECYKARAYRLEPMDDKGIYTLDGEMVPYGPIQGTTRPGAARVLKIVENNASDIEIGIN